MADRIGVINMKKILVTLSMLVLGFSILVNTAKAAPDNNPFYQALAELENSVNESFNGVQSRLSQLSNDLVALTARVSQNETDIALLSERADELEEDLGSLGTDVSENSTQIGLHDTQIVEMQAEIELLKDGLDPSPIVVTFADARPQPFNSEWVEVSGYQNISMEVFSSISIVQYGIHYTNDPSSATNTTGFVEQARVWCSGGTTCPSATFPILGSFYRVSTGTASGNITARGYLTL
ncbi:hypothetical protein ACFL2C_01280 [Patescibacteria group bacterium]